MKVLVVTCDVGNAGGNTRGPVVGSARCERAIRVNFATAITAHGWAFRKVNGKRGHVCPVCLTKPRTP